MLICIGCVVASLWVSYWLSAHLMCMYLRSIGYVLVVYVCVCDLMVIVYVLVMYWLCVGYLVVSVLVIGCYWRMVICRLCVG